MANCYCQSAPPTAESSRKAVRHISTRKKIKSEKPMAKDENLRPEELFPVWTLEKSRSLDVDVTESMIYFSFSTNNFLASSFSPFSASLVREGY